MKKTLALVVAVVRAVLLVFIPASLAEAARAADFHVAAEGNDAHPGTAAEPFATLGRAQRAARLVAGREPVTVLVGKGVYYLPDTLVLTAEDSGTQAAPVVYRAQGDGPVVLSGGVRLAELVWEPYRDGIVVARTPPGLVIDQLFVDGRRQPMARFPNFDPAVRPYGGYSADAFGSERAQRWADPTGGYIHAMHSAHWGGYHYRITGKKENGEVAYEGGWQNNRQMGMHREHRFVENVFEELDAPGEWYHDAKVGTLHYRPPADVDPKTATFEVVRLRHLVEFRGAKHVALRGFILRHAARTFMETKEPLLRSDWTVYRGGAVLFHGAEDCAVEDCELDQLGGNAIFASGANRRLRVVGCDIHDTGASAVAFVGEPKAVRNPLFEYGQRQAAADIDRTPGPKTDDYPADCVVEDCLIRRFGMVEKQATGVQIAMARGIVIRHCSIYDGSRAGINIGDGCWGGHVIEFCDVFDTVQETGDHGSFNSWGRDRYWGLKDAAAEDLAQLALLDAVEPTVIRNNRWRCDHGWDVDLDDGSSNYQIHDNLFLKGGLKLREGFHRRVWNNIAVGNTLHPHVWYDGSGDVVTGNIWMAAYRPAVMRSGTWGREVDRNLFTTTDADRTRFAANGCDAHSLVGDPRFVDPAAGDYRVRDGSPALEIGFRNFPMDRFGVRAPRLKAIARTPELPGVVSASSGHAAATRRTPPVPVVRSWQGMRVKELVGEEHSAFGVSRESGGVHVREGSWSGIEAGDLIQGINGRAVKTFADLARAQDAAAGAPLEVAVVRGQEPRTIRVAAYTYAAAGAAEPAAGVAAVKAITTRPGTSNEPVATLVDGALAKNYGPVFMNGVTDGLYKLDLGTPQSIARVDTFSHAQGGVRGRQRFRLYGSAAAADPGWQVEDAAVFTPLIDLDSGASKPGDFLSTSVRQSDGMALGSYRWLVWAVAPVTETAGGENTAYQEFQVIPTASPGNP